MEAVRTRAEAISSTIPSSSIRESEGAIGGGSTPDKTLPTYVVEIQTASASRLERQLRLNHPPILARIETGNVLLDCRTIQDSEVKTVIHALSGKISE
jgi:L-seryl-tRNA(Ser) seleniumtransferase